MASLTVAGGIHAARQEAAAVQVGAGDVDLSGIAIAADDGHAIVHGTES
ncbi:hypothetical protein [Streptomyces sp. NPDC005752]